MAYTPQSGPRKKHIGLSAREFTKVTGTIASVRRNIPQDDSPSSRRPSRANEYSSRDEPSFIAETSFVRAPLNSRVTSISLPPKAKGKAKQESLERIPLHVQEALILEDLLYVLLGIEGTFITFHPDYSPEDDDPLQGIRFVVTPTLDSSLRDLVERILPLGMYYTAITCFIELRSHLDFGLVNHALCAAIRDMLKDYQTLLSQLEHAFNTASSFSLQKLWFYVHPTVHTLSLIYQLIIEIESADEALESPSPSPSPSPSDAEEEARNAALGLGGAKLKAVLSELTNSPATVAIMVKGGEVLTIIYERMQNMSGDPTASALYGALLRSAGRPYVEMIRSWVTTGSLHDPYEELLLKESKFINRNILDVDYTDEYWEGRYTLRDGSTLSSSRRAQAGVPPPRSISGRLPGGACVPPLLEGWKHKILLAGKYLNVIRECGIDVRLSQECTRPQVEEMAMDDERFYTFLESAYAHANRTLLSLLLREQQLVPRLRTLKRLFFLSQSSFLTHFLDLASGELRKSARGVSLGKLQSLLELTLDGQGSDGGVGLGEGIGGSSDVKVTMAETGLYAFLMKVVSVSGIGASVEKGIISSTDKGEHEREKEKEKEDKKPILAIDALTLDYTIKFPLSLVVSRKTILRYQLLFRFLLHLKHAEQTLSSMWLEQQTPPWRVPMLEAPEFGNWRLRVCLLRARMLTFVQQILAFATFEVLEPNWRNLEAKLARVRTVEELMRDHVDFLDTCLKECMLTSAKLIHAYSRLIVTCSTFAHYGPMFTKSANNALEAMDTPEGDQGMAKRMETLGKFETNFNHWFQVHLNCVQYYASSENVSLLPLVVRLNSVRALG